MLLQWHPKNILVEFRSALNVGDFRVTWFRVTAFMSGAADADRAASDQRGDGEC